MICSDLTVISLNVSIIIITKASTSMICSDLTVISLNVSIIIITKAEYVDDMLRLDGN